MVNTRTSHAQLKIVDIHHPKVCLSTVIIVVLKENGKRHLKRWQIQLQQIKYS